MERAKHKNCYPAKPRILYYNVDDQRYVIGTVEDMKVERAYSKSTLTRMTYIDVNDPFQYLEGDRGKAAYYMECEEGSNSFFVFLSYSKGRYANLNITNASMKNSLGCDYIAENRAQLLEILNDWINGTPYYKPPNISGLS